MSNDNKFCDDIRAQQSSYFVGNAKIIFDRKSRGRNPIHKCVRPPAYCKQVQGILKQPHNSRDSAGCNRSIKSELLTIHRDTPFTPYTRRCASFSDRRVEFTDKPLTVEPSASSSAGSLRNSKRDKLSTILANFAQAQRHNDADVLKSVASQLLAKVSSHRSTASSPTTRSVVVRRMKQAVCEPSQTQLCQIRPSLSECDIDCAKRKKRASKMVTTVSAVRSGVVGHQGMMSQVERTPAPLPKRVRKKLRSLARTKSKPVPAAHFFVDDTVKDLAIGAKLDDKHFKMVDKPTVVIDRSSAYDLISNFSRVLKTLKERKLRCDAKTRRRMLTRTGVYECPASRSLLAGIMGANTNASAAASVSAPSLSSEMDGSSSASAGVSSDGSWSSTEESADESTTPEHGDVAAQEHRRHIHPCVCDLTKAQRKKIEKYLNERLRMQMRFEKRIKEIEEELRRLAEEEEERRQREELEKELYDDEYEMVGGQRRRKKRSARRVSMISLGVRQVINWRKEPKIAVKYTKTYELRRANPTYCKPKVSIALVPKPIQCLTNVSIRHNRTSELRTKFNKDLKEVLHKREYRKYPNKPEFVLKIR